MENSSKNLIKSTLIVMATIFVVLAVIAVLTGFFKATAKQVKLSREEPFIRTKAILGNLHIAVNMFKLDTGRYPSQEVGLIELIKQPKNIEGWNPGGYLEYGEYGLPKDGWRNDFVYILNPESGKPFVIISYGADGKEGGEGYDADIWSTDVE